MMLSFEGRYIWLFNLTGLLGIVWLSQTESFSWHWGIALFAMYFLISAGGLSAGFHRLLIHRCITVPRWYMYILTYLGCLGLTGSPITWSSHHYVHHRYSDTEDDPTIPPNSPYNRFKVGRFVFPLYHTFNRQLLNKHLKTSLLSGRHLLNDYFQRWMQDHYYAVVFSWYALIMLCLGVQGLVYLGLLPSILSRLSITLTNNIQHNFGYQAKEHRSSHDQSKNVWWLFPLMFGENWHNNHHVYPTLPSTQLRWWEIDLVYLVFLKPFDRQANVRHL